eukprot:scaffold18712_cov14-Tisochrysis_lutea.AAC.1
MRVGEGVAVGVDADGEDSQGNAHAGQGGEGGRHRHPSANGLHGLHKELARPYANGHDAHAAAHSVGERAADSLREGRQTDSDVGRGRGGGGPGVSQKRNSRGGMVLNRG